MRRRLSEHLRSGQSLNDWYREVFLSSDLNLARPNIFSNEFERSILGGEWCAIKVPHFNQHIIEHNQSVIQNFITNLQFDRNSRIPVIETQLSMIHDELLNLLRFTSPVDVGDYTALLYALGRHLEENPDESCTLYLMSDFDNPRERSLSTNNHINQLFQGPSSNYPGDRAIIGTGITFQIHILNLIRENQILYNGVPAIACYIPEEIGRDFIRWA